MEHKGLNGIHGDIEQIGIRLDRLEREGSEVVKELQFLNRTLTSVLVEVTATRAVLKDQLDSLISRASGVVPGGVMPVKWAFIIIISVVVVMSPKASVVSDLILSIVGR